MDIQLSHRMDRLPAYLLGKIKKMTYERRRLGHDVIDLNMGNPSDPTPPAIVEKLREAVTDPRNQRYSASAGIYNLRREVARKYKRLYDVDLDPNGEVIATIGSKEGFSHLCLALLGPGDTAIVTKPAFAIHTYAVVLAGANVIGVELGNDAAFLERVENVITHMEPKPKVMILNFPNNPTTMCVDLAFWDEVVAMGKRHNIMVISDFAYGETCFDGYKAPSFMQAKGAKDVGVEFTTMSKSYNMAGWRIGYCVGNAKMIDALATIKGYYDYGIFQAIQIASIIAMREHDETVIEQAKIYEGRRDALVRCVRKLGWDVEPPKATMFVWAKVPTEHLGPYGGSTVDFCLDMIEKADVAMCPGGAFGNEGEGYVRIAMVENEHRIRQAFRNLERVLNKPATSAAS
ncbi:MAG: aminotransferase class I/II-fold pyridoxal phosphate-dependent enzyme [Planctomycetes bacterium]|nr:aminotransferase class I/II-fold pyridoxal phosphate-dependent enzyme [Planctomycetota bacterium]